MNVKQLKVLAKERGLTRYNNLKKDELVKLHDEFDEDIEFINEEDDKKTETEDDDEEDEENYKLKYVKLLEKYNELEKKYLELKTKLNK